MNICTLYNKIIIIFCNKKVLAFNPFYTFSRVKIPLMIGFIKLLKPQQVFHVDVANGRSDAGIQFRILYIFIL